jgi:2-keto-4-pentenoate hydratase/2-oxohepta-3-ene-1,7-dioic acid hydratase in catechol pathway
LQEGFLTLPAFLANEHDPVWMRNGDVCEIEIEGVGTLRNAIADETP